MSLTSWIPNAVAATLLADRTAQPIVAWLAAIRASIEEYDPLIVVRPPSPEPEGSHASSGSPDSAFDEILSQLGKEIFNLEKYQQNLGPEEKEVSLSILNIFDECLDQMSDRKLPEMTAHIGDFSDGESTISDKFATSTPAQCVKVSEVDDSEPNRTRLKSSSSSSSIHDDLEIYDNSSQEWTKLLESSSDSESTCWSYKGSSEPELNVNKNTYAAVWSQSSGFHNSDGIIRRVIALNRATVSRVSYDTASEFEPTEYSVYALHEVGDLQDRCEVAPVAAMSPERPIDDGAYEPVRDALTDENIYEEIEFGCYTDEGFSCGTSVEVESCSISASSEGVDRESPLYANLRDHDAYAITPDVIFWKNLLLDPYYNDDEEDEWITPEECAVFSREQRPPLVIPRITQYRAVRMRPPAHSPYPEDTPTSSMRLYDRLGNWSPSSERSRADIDRSFSKASSDSPPFGKINKRLGGSTENLLGIARRPPHLQLPASSSGDSLDVEIREPRAVGHARSRKSKSMMSPKQRIRSPVPAPRNLPVVEPSVILEGTVKRTKFFENNKKCKKNWLEFYMTLTPTKLVFYKDNKTYLASKGLKPSGTPPSPTSAWPESVLPMLDARVLPCVAMHTRRHSRSFVLSVKYDQYLIQCETEEGARLWLRTIEGIICKLLTSKMADSPVSQYQSSNTDLESLGRTPPARHRTKPKGSSNEDLSDSTETSAQKTHVKTRLKKFFARRPAMEVLVKKGIYKDEPVFGRNLEEVCPTTSPRVPEFLMACVKEIESSLENMCTDGLYRASGNLSQVQKVRLEIDQNHLNVIQNNSDVHVLTGSLKLFLRELKEPLIPCSMFDRVLAACSLKPREAKIKEFRDIINSLPQCNRDTLKYLLEHLLRVTSYSEQNRMHTANLAIVFGPTILWAPAEKAHNIAVDCIQQNNVVDILLNEFKDIFAEDTKGKKKA